MNRICHFYIDHRSLLNFLRHEESVYLDRTAKRPMSAAWADKLRQLQLELRRSELYR